MNEFEAMAPNEVFGANRAQRFAEIESLIHARERDLYQELRMGGETGVEGSGETSTRTE